MKERPILFSAPMVRAILDGTKTQTRRVAKLTDAGHVKEPDGHRRWHTADFDARLACPYGQPGDRLWVRETWAHGIHAMAAGRDQDGPFVYAATDRDDQRLGDRWRPSIYMPRRASRITLEIIGGRVERLKDISPSDCVAEGVQRLPLQGGESNPWYTADVSAGQILHSRSATGAYHKLWESINGPDSWTENPLVWVVEFQPIDAATSAAVSL